MPQYVTVKLDKRLGRIGMTLQGTTVCAVEPGFGADKAGIESGMRIMAIGRYRYGTGKQAHNVPEALRRHDGEVTVTLMPAQQARAAAAAAAVAHPGKRARGDADHPDLPDSEVTERAKRQRLAAAAARSDLASVVSAAKLAQDSVEALISISADARQDLLVDAEAHRAAVEECDSLVEAHNSMVDRVEQLQKERNDRDERYRFFPRHFSTLSTAQLDTLEEEVFTYLQQIRRHKVESNVCKVCMQHPQVVVVMPCKHMSMCEACSTKVNECPLCRGAIADRILVHTG